MSSTALPPTCTSPNAARRSRRCTAPSPLTRIISLTLFSQNSGYLHETLGTTVTAAGIVIKKDQVLATVVDEIGLRLRTQALNDHEAAVSRLNLGPNTLGLLKSAQDTLNAYKKLPNPDAVPKVQRDAAANEVARLNGIVENEKLELQRGVDATASALKAADDQLKRTEIVAPFDGILTVVNFNDNAYVLPNQALFTVATKDSYVAGQVNEEDVGQLLPGMKADVRLYAFSTTTFTATLAAVLPSPDPNSSRYTVTLTLDQPPPNLMFGMTGEMNVILGRKENALVVPARALQVDQVLIVEDGIVEQRTVKVGFKSLEYAEILDGLNSGAQVIVADQDTFRVGESVRPVPINGAKPMPAKKM